HTDYAVVVTNSVLDKNGKALGPGTVASILRFSNPIVASGKSTLLGVDDATAGALDRMRLQLKPVFAKLAVAPLNIDASKVAMAYTFRTQTILTPAVQLAALPYLRTQADAAAKLPIAATFVAETPSDAFDKFGAAHGASPNAVPLGNIDEILEV